MEPQLIVVNSKVQLPILIDTLNDITNGEPFVIIIFIGKSGIGKSFLSQKISGVKHELNNDPISRTTIGAYISYCGRMDDVIYRLHLEMSEVNLADNVHVFSIDPESINSFAESSQNINFLFPLISISSVMVYSTNEPAITVQSNLLKTIQFFARDTSLIIRIYNFSKYETLNETNYRNQVMLTALYSKLIEDNVEFVMIPDAPAEAKLKIRKMTKKILFKEIVKKSTTKIWKSTLELSNYFQELTSVCQSNFFCNSFNGSSPGKYLSDDLLEELRNYLRMKKKEIEKSDINNFPTLLEEVYKYLLNRFSEFSEKYELDLSVKQCCWENIKHDFNIIKTLLLNKYHELQKKKKQNENSNLRHQEIKKLLTNYSTIIPEAANEAIKNIIRQSQNPLLIPQIESDKRQFECVFKNQIMEIRYIADQRIVDIIDSDIEKISSIIDDFATMVISIMRTKKNVETAKKVIKVLSIIGIVISYFAEKAEKNVDPKKAAGINGSDVEVLGDLGCKSFKVVDAVLDGIFPPQNVDQLNVPNFVHKDYAAIYEENFSQILTTNQ
ncbi:hypothetical protein M9Y10_029607 [Tritrichomonas musculus]|uniref:G domain-containing protein n=1 Tax=Tritrichomonas musculus TaxID=1915356 RepID=A0ABR2KNI3_9EUKA